MSTVKLDDVVRDYYRGQTLDPETVRRWTRSPPRDRRRRVALITMGTLGLVTVAVGGLSLWRGNRVERQIAEEVWFHHQHRQPPEARVEALAALGPALARIDFPTPGSSRLSDLAATGGRHCSLLGQLAARADLVDDQGGTHTLYVTPVSARLGSIDEEFVAMEGGAVKMWQESGLFYALASPFDAVPGD